MDWTPIAELMFTPGQVLAVVLVAGIVVANLTSGRPFYALPRWEHAFGFVGLSLVVDGQYMAMADAPKERMMGDVVRILYVHVPSAWATLVVFAVCMVCAVAYLVTSYKIFDQLVESTAEVGVLLSIILQATGMLFAKPTWGVFWDWDPRLVSTAVMMLAFIGVLTLRSVIDDAEQRATWTSVGAILASTSMVVTYMSVQWWRSLHQTFSTPDTIDSPITLILRINGFAFLFLSTWLVARRWRLAAAQAKAEEAPPLPAEEVPA